MPSCSRPVALTMPCVICLGESDRIADRKHDVADAQAVGAAKGDDRQRRKIDLQDGEVGIRIAPDDVRVGDTSVGQLRIIESRIRNHVMIGHDVAAHIDDDAGSRAALQCAAGTAAGINRKQRIPSGGRAMRSVTSRAV